MGLLKRIAGWARKAYSFSTTSYSRDALIEWYLSNGYRGIAGYLGGADQAFRVSAVLGCMKIISEDVGSLPLRVHERLNEREMRIAFDHPLYTLLHDAPNAETSAITFRESMTVHAALFGKAYARIIRDDSGRIIALQQVDNPHEVHIERNEFGRRFYRIGDPRTGEVVEEDNILDLQGFSIDGRFGANILDLASTTIGLTSAQTEYAKRFFSQDQTPNLVLKFPGKLGAEGVKLAKEAWAKYMKGPENWHSPAVLQEGGAIEQLHPDAQRSQLNEQRTFQLQEICRLWRVPPHKLASLDKMTYNNVEHLNISYFNETLRPWLVRWEQAIQRKLFTLQERAKFYAEHSIEGLLRGDFKTQTEGFSRLLERGVYSINEVRRYLNLNPIEGGDQHHIQLNMQQVQEAADAVEDETTQGEKVLRFRRIQ